jgi:hypothetical protein
MRGIDWQVSSMTQIYSHLSTLLSRIEQLDIQEQIGLLESPLQVDMDNTQRLDLFHPFTAVQTLHISRELGLLSHAFLPCFASFPHAPQPCSYIYASCTVALY